jgi:indolepyruvate ferredoxin oxidoreductase alpha subunit
MPDMVLLGNEAVAMGAIHAGLWAAYGYPGTPSSEIIGFLQNDPRAAAAAGSGAAGGSAGAAGTEKAGAPAPYIASWCANEKTAYEAAVGVSMVGRRALVTMKHVGLNVAADPFINSALLDIHGGLVLAVADDPGMHSSQNEQDSRFFADYARIVCLEPRNQAEAYAMTREAFDLSEELHIPVMVRLVTRLSHSRAVVRVGQARERAPLSKSADPNGWILLPAIARQHWDALLAAQPRFRELSEASPYNSLVLNDRYRELGVVTTGLGRNYYEENLEELEGKLGARPSHLHIGFYPLPEAKLRLLAAQVKRLVVIEEGYPLVERALRGVLPLPIPIDGKENGTLPASGELTPDNVRPALGLPARRSLAFEGPKLAGRPPQLCAGCPHRDAFDALNQALASYGRKIVTSDIGCYTLGFLPPYQAVETCMCMGASIGMARGAAEAGFHPVVATIGDSTFLHSGLTGLADAVAAKANLTLLILDNSTTAMTGGQPTLLASSQLPELIRGLGVEPAHIRIINPLRKHTEENAKIIREEIEYRGVSVVIAQRECIQTRKSRRRQEAAE